MGSGKTTLGFECSKLLDYKFVDTDHEIESHCNSSIPNIFLYNGEEYFRDIESQILESILSSNNHPVVISLGGGVFTRDKNINLIRKFKALSVFINPDEKIIQARLAKSNNRPALISKNTSEREEFVSQTLKQRLPFYQKADITFEYKNNIDFHTRAIDLLKVISSFYNEQKN